MDAFFTATFYAFTFLAMYVQVFFLLTFLEKRKEIVVKQDPNRPDSAYPKVTIVVPCWNEEKTVAGTINSLLALDYPHDKLHIVVVDDGSTDGTLAALSAFEHIPNVEIISKENGGKHTAMNLAIENATTEFISCLDADSFVRPDALKRMIPYFDNPEVMAVCPTIVIDKPKTLVERAQKSEYQLSAYIKKMLGLVGGIHVTPGPFSVYRVSVFRNLGPYKKAHNTEDMEIAYRMQKNGYKIEQCHDAIVYTKGMPSAYRLYKQRLRWIYGFINNTIDYRGLIFKKKYGTFSLFTIPAGIVSIIAAIFVFSRGLYLLGEMVVSKIIKIQTVGVSLPDVFSKNNFDWFYVNTHSLLFITIILYGFVFFALTMGSYLSENKKRPSLAFVWYFIIYSVIAPLWILRALYKTVMRRETAWR